MAIFLTGYEPRIVYLMPHFLEKVTAFSQTKEETTKILTGPHFPVDELRVGSRLAFSLRLTVFPEHFMPSLHSCFHLQAACPQISSQGCW